MTFYIKSNGKIIKMFNDDTKINTHNKGEEYELLMKILDKIKERIRMNDNLDGVLLGNIDIEFLTQRFLGRNIFIATEGKIKEEKFNNPPDAFFVSDNILTIVDHTRIDGLSFKESSFKNREFNGSVLWYIVRKMKKEGYSDNQIIEKVCNEAEIDNATWKNNLENVFAKHIKDRLNTFQCVDKYISNGTSKEIIAQDILKLKESWLLIEENTPTEIPNEYWSWLASLMSQYNEEIQGVIWVYWAALTEYPNSLDNVLFIKNNESSLKKLFSVGCK